MSSYAPKATLVLYSPLDAGPVDPEWVEKAGCVSRFVLFSEYARSEVLKALPPSSAPSLEVIPPGVDREVFFPLGTRAGNAGGDGVGSTLEAKRALKLFGEAEIADSFVVLNANRNQPRKRLDLTLKGFAAFARGKPKQVQLYLHTGIQDTGWHVGKLAKRYGIDDRLILTHSKEAVPGISSEQLNLVYNACDVGLNTATGEGWGLPSFEHAATGKAQVVPRIGTLAEIWLECAEFVEPSSEVVYEHVLSEGKAVSPEGVGAALERLYVDREHHQRVAWACYERATRPEHDWRNIGQRWHELFQEVLES